MRVLGLGQASLDIITLVTGFPREDAKKEVLAFLEQGGGPVATALVALRRLGVEAAFSGVVSDDYAGARIREGLIDEGVDVAALVERPGGESQRAFIIVNRETATRTILWKRPTVAELSKEEIKRDWLSGAGFLLLDGLMGRASIRAAELARESGVPVMLDAGSPRPALLKLLPHTDYIVGSEEFAGYFSPDPEEAAVKISSFSPRAVTVTLGEKGSVTWQGGRVFRTPAFRVRALDTTGAGDVFHGGYIYGLLQGWGLEKTVTFASAFAALKCLELGGRTGIPTLEHTLEFMDSAPTR